MDIRMLPIRHVFERFPRMVRDLTRGQGKEIELIIEGEATHYQILFDATLNDVAADEIDWNAIYGPWKLDSFASAPVATDQPRVRRSRSSRPWATSASAASFVLLALADVAGRKQELRRG